MLCLDAAFDRIEVFTRVPSVIADGVVSCKNRITPGIPPSGRAGIRERWRDWAKDHVLPRVPRPKIYRSAITMKRGTKNLAMTALLFGSAGIGAQGTTEPLSGLPLAPGFERTGDPVQTYKYCGKSEHRLVCGRRLRRPGTRKCLVHARPAACRRVCSEHRHQNLHYARWHDRR
jgi:hypothetical protein